MNPGYGFKRHFVVEKRLEDLKAYSENCPLNREEMGDTEIGMKSPLSLFGASIGFSFRYYMDGIVANDSVKMLSLNGVYPSAENIQNRTYPIIAEFYAIYRSDNDNPNIPILIDWILSDEGQQIIEQCGYVRIN